MDSILQAVASALQTGLTGREIKAFFYGKQEIPAERDLPMVMIYPSQTRISNDILTGTVRDGQEFDITIEVIVSLKKYFNNKTGQGSVLKALQELIKTMEECETTGERKTNTVAYILRHDVKLGGKALYNDNVVIDYNPYYTVKDFPVASATLNLSYYTRKNR
jgi:hypothetical protein